MTEKFDTTERLEAATRPTGTPSGGTTRRVLLIAVGALLVLLTNAIVFVLPPLLPAIQAEYQLTSVSSVTWIFTLLTLGGGAGFVLIPRLSDVIGDRDTAVLSGAALTGVALVAAIGDSYAALLIGAVVMASLTSGMNLLGVGISYQYMIRGGVLAAAVIFDVMTRKKRG